LAISDEIRGWLYGWLGKAKLGTPSYSFTPLANCGEKTRFRYVYQFYVFIFHNFCFYVRMNTTWRQHHVELGISVNKKDAATNAARDFAYFLTRQKLLDPTELPKLTASMLEAPNPDSFGRDSALENGILLNKTEGNSCTTTDVSVDMQFIPSSRIKTEHQQQKAEEIALASSLRLSFFLTISEKLNSYQMENIMPFFDDWNHQHQTFGLLLSFENAFNSKMHLNEFVQKIKQPPLRYDIRSYVSFIDLASESIKKDKKNFCCRSVTFRPESAAQQHLQCKRQFEQTFSARTEGSTKNTAEATYALSLMRQLFHNQLLADISFIVNDELSKEIAHYLALVGVDEVQPSPETSASNPVSLLITQKLNQFEPSQAISDGFVSWGPALENWNDHGSH
uniref:DRBM domain-containing protein n=1 Tax=Wuchereria bancrofti TaxID=6293 RepID=A0A1I8EU82_WUCBA